MTNLVLGFCSVLAVFQRLVNDRFCGKNRCILLTVSCQVYRHPSMFLCLYHLQTIGPQSFRLKSLSLVAGQGLPRCSNQKVCLLSPMIALQLEGLMCHPNIKWMLSVLGASAQCSILFSYLTYYHKYLIQSVSLSGNQFPASSH